MLQKENRELSKKELDNIREEAKKDSEIFIKELKEKKTKRDILPNNCENFTENREKEEIDEFLDFLKTDFCGDLLEY